VPGLGETLRIAVAGLGTVGLGTLQLLRKDSEVIASRCGCRIEVTAVCARDRSKDRGMDLSPFKWFDDPVVMASESDADVVVEMIGGSDGPARATVEAALGSGKHVVTANKALIAHHGTTLGRLAEERDLNLGYEAAVAGGIPIIKTLREGLAANRITRVYGILNGTSNYILTSMRETGRDFAEVLAEAQALGYAEVDPSFDIDGVDAAHKLSILTALAFGSEVDFDSVHIEGIRDVSALDIAFADELGYRIKLLGIANLTDGGIEQRVHPTLVAKDAPIAAVEGVFNAVVAEGDFVGSIMTEGQGAGAGPTASAVVADLIDIARGLKCPTFAIPASSLERGRMVPMERHVSCHYLRLHVQDLPGVIADVAAVLRDERISVESILQHGRGEAEGASVPVVITTHETSQAAMTKALEKIAAFDTVLEPPRMIRIEAL